MNDTPLPEPLEDFLQHPPSVPPSPEFQQSVLAQTAATLRSPSPRRWPIAASFAASILLALVWALIAWWSAQFGPPPRQNVVEHQVAPEPEKPQPKPKEPTPPMVVKQVSPRELEWIAFDAQDDAQRVRLFFQAGDLYLDWLQDYESAVRCYQQALDNCEPQQLEINPTDNWLVMAVKRDYRKE